MAGDRSATSTLNLASNQKLRELMTSITPLYSSSGSSQLNFGTMAPNADADDPVYAKSTFLTSYMSNHADTLVAYILYRLQEKTSRSSKQQLPSAAQIKEPRMLRITSKEMELQYKDASDGLTVKTVRLCA